MHLYSTFAWLVRAWVFICMVRTLFICIVSSTLWPLAFSLSLSCITWASLDQIAFFKHLVTQSWMMIEKQDNFYFKSYRNCDNGREPEEKENEKKKDKLQRKRSQGDSQVMEVGEKLSQRNETLHIAASRCKDLVLKQLRHKICLAITLALPTILTHIRPQYHAIFSP